jgi:metal-responsive CopG/Arc/MetJ family transcriptional regulator
MLKTRIIQNRKVTFRLDETRLNELDALAYQQGVSVSSIIRHLVIRYLEEARRFGKGGVL